MARSFAPLKMTGKAAAFRVRPSVRVRRRWHHLMGANLGARESDSYATNASLTQKTAGYFGFSVHRR